MEADALLRSPVPPVASKDAGRLSNSGRGLPHLPFPAELVPFDEALRDVSAGRLPNQDGADIVARHGAQLLEVKAAERRGGTLMSHEHTHTHTYIHSHTIYIDADLGCVHVSKRENYFLWEFKKRKKSLYFFK